VLFDGDAGTRPTPTLIAGREMVDRINGVRIEELEDVIRASKRTPRRLTP